MAETTRQNSNAGFATKNNCRQCLPNLPDHENYLKYLLNRVPSDPQDLKPTTPESSELGLGK